MKWVLDEKILSEQQLAEIDKDVDAVVEEAVQFADESPKPVSHSFEMLGREKWLVTTLSTLASGERGRRKEKRPPELGGAICR